MVTLEDVGRDTHIATIARPVQFYGKQEYRQEAIRAIREGNHYRIDFAVHIYGAWLPWEAINDRHYETLEAAADALEAYASGENI